MTATPKPLVLIILDGFGHSESPDYNAIYAAKKPVWDRLLATQPHGLISGSGMDVGLPDGQMGNSEVGHMNLGAGRVVYQDFTRVTKAIRDGEFFENPVIAGAVDKAVAADKAVHILGLLSPGGVHSHEDHLVAMAQMAARRGAGKIYLHAFLDGRDTPPKSAQPSLERLDATFAGLGKGRIASIIGRYFAMDRDNRWDRVQAAYELIVDGKAEFTADSSVAALEAAYARGESDEFVKATAVVPAGAEAVRVEDGDAVIFMNFRADRARELSRAFVEPVFKEFPREQAPQLAGFVMLTQYAASIPAPCAFPPEPLTNVLGEYLAKHGKTQLRIAETEKYAHVTFFFSGGDESEYPGERRVLVPSPKVATYDLQPEMSAPTVTDRLLAELASDQRPDVTILNFANADMVGHTGVVDAAVQAVRTIDDCLRRIVPAFLDTGGTVAITADHGNVEQMVDPGSGEPHTAHTSNPVPFLLCGDAVKGKSLRAGGRLCDIATTLLPILGLDKDPGMEGVDLLS